ncbi:MAG TPA: DUF1566 domain-containing protein [Bryobacteraceae bacterium]|nr:DUF1566 domain-containing protein [Bryobacteraceae bacterium]
MASGANITRADHTDAFIGNRIDDIAIYLTVIHYVALPNIGNRGLAGAPLTGANFMAYDGSNPRVDITETTADRIQGPQRRILPRLGSPAGTRRFTDNRDGTVTDSNTGLIWLKNAGCFDPANWADALAKVNALATGGCGLSDGSTAGQWRLPNTNELESMVDVSASNPALTPGNPFTGVSLSIYWSSTSYFGGQAGSPSAWAIQFSDGRYINDSVSNSKQTAFNQVWAVRDSGVGSPTLQATGAFVAFADGDDGSVQSGVPPTFPRWLDKGDGTIIDTVTGLIWLKQADCIHQTWANAMTAVHALSAGQCGLIDGSAAGAWRMPNRKEMLSLSDRAQNNHADFFNRTYLNLDYTVFQAAIFSNFIAYQYYWTSSVLAANLTSAWTVFSCDFGVYNIPRESVGYTLAVRSPR